MWTHFILYNIGLCYSAIIMYLNHITWTLAAMYWHQQSIWIVFLRIRTQIWTFLINCSLFKLEQDSVHPPSSFIFSPKLFRRIWERDIKTNCFIFFCEMFLEYTWILFKKIRIGNKIVREWTHNDTQGNMHLYLLIVFTFSYLWTDVKDCMKSSLVFSDLLVVFNLRPAEC